MRASRPLVESSRHMMIGREYVHFYSFFVTSRHCRRPGASTRSRQLDQSASPPLAPFRLPICECVFVAWASLRQSDCPQSFR